MLLPLLLAAAAETATPRLLRPDDVFEIAAVDDPQVSPEGTWVAYTVGRPDRKKDETDTDVFMAPLAGGEPVRLTVAGESNTHPRFSPDGRFLAFLSDRGGDTQVWLLDRRGGEAVPLTSYAPGATAWGEPEGPVSALAWSPDSTRLALVVADPGTKVEEDQTVPPIVIRRLQFLRDEEGYLLDRRGHVHVIDVRTKGTVQVTAGAWDDREPAWSPDGTRLAFVSNRREPDPDRSQDTDVFVVEARAGAVARPLATNPGEDHAPAWSPDGKEIAFVAGGDPADLWYGATRVAVAPVGPGPVRSLTAALDRNVLAPRFSADGRRIYFMVEDGGNQHLARVAAAGGAVERVVAGERDIQAYGLGPKDEIALLASTPDRPFEVFAAGAAGALRSLSRANDAFLATVRTASVERLQAKSADGTAIEAFLMRPPDAPPGARVPGYLDLHGGPTLQFSTAFDLERQVLAAAGYAVIAPNPRGSTGYGTAFSRAIWADWGNKDFEDVMAALDAAVARGAVDPDRLAVGGWSYGGMLTDYVITKSTRFKAAVSGASEVNYLANYGTDHYQYEWERELGLPWENAERWIRLSPFFHLDRVITPTLVVGGSADRNVPLLNSEQLYLVLRRRGVPTELVIYPDQTHDLAVPSYLADFYTRQIAWCDRFVR